MYYFFSFFVYLLQLFVIIRSDFVAREFCQNIKPNEPFSSVHEYINIAVPNTDLGEWKFWSDSFLAAKQAFEDAAPHFRGDINDDIFAQFKIGHPETSWGPGVSIFDFDNDGDMDIFVSTIDGSNHSIFRNNWIESNQLSLTFTDIGYFGEDQKGAAVCFGDVDSDGFTDVAFMGYEDVDRIYLNNGGDGTFNLIFETLDTFASTNCLLADFNKDGFLDLYVGHNVRAFRDALFFVKWDLFEHNSFYLNLGNNTYTNDIAFERGLHNTVFENSTDNGRATHTWAITMLDVDFDGDLDIFQIDDRISYRDDFLNRGIIHIWKNDGNGYFVDEPINDTASERGIGPYVTGDNMLGIFGDINCDRNLDLFVTNTGPYFWLHFQKSAIFPGPPTNPFFADVKNCAVPDGHNRWFLGTGNKNADHFKIMKNIYALPFGWGGATWDYDHDGDNDYLFHGGLQTGYRNLMADNHGTMMVNKGCNKNFDEPEWMMDLGLFERDPQCSLPNNKSFEPYCTVHHKRMVKGFAIGDLNNDGHFDIVTASDFNINHPDNECEAIQYFLDTDGDETAVGDPVMDNLAVHYFTWKYNGTAFNLPKCLPRSGNLMVEMHKFKDNNFVPENGWVSIKLKGMLNVLNNGAVNRDAIGSIIWFTPILDEDSSSDSSDSSDDNDDDDNDNELFTTALSYSQISYFSQHSLESIFGLGPNAKKGNAEIYYVSKNGGLYNKVCDIYDKQRIEVPEIPCNYKDDQITYSNFKQCLTDNLKELKDKNIISSQFEDDLYECNKKAFKKYHNIDDDDDDDDDSNDAFNTSINGSQVNFIIVMVIISVFVLLISVTFGMYCFYKKYYKPKVKWNNNQNQMNESQNQPSLNIPNNNSEIIFNDNTDFDPKINKPKMTNADSNPTKPSVVSIQSQQ